MDCERITRDAVFVAGGREYTCTFSFEKPLSDYRLKLLVLDDMRRRKARGDFRGAWKAMHQFNRTIAARHKALGI